MGWDVCRAHSSFPLLRKVPQLLRVLPWAVLWAVLGRLSVSPCPVQEPLAELSGSCAARPGALLYSHGKSPFPGQGSSSAQHHVPYSNLIF